MSLRKHQSEFKAVIGRIKSGEPINTIYCHVTPGGGKSILPIMAGQLITAGMADKLLWIAPRLSLTDQAEREFVNPYFRAMFDHNLNIRQSTNEINPCRGLSGASTTYNAAGMDEGILFREFQQRRYILIMDEFHHVQEDSLWHKKISPLYAMAAYRIMMTGTLERGDQNRIAFVPYRGSGKTASPYLKENDETAVIRYTRTDALAEKAIIPLQFHLSDGSAEWEDNRGRKVMVASMDKMNEADANKALYTALKTEYADHLLSSGIAHWQEWRRTHKTSKCLVVTSNITEAKRHIASLGKIAARSDIATSEDSEAAQKVINKMKAGQLDVIVTVAMAYEGLNIPEVSHVICLTRIRSVPWIEQMTARANRIDQAAGPYNEQIGHIFAPADPLFKEVMKKIEAEQAPVMQERSSRFTPSSREGSEDGGGFRLEPAPGGIIPLSSAMTGKREMILGQREIPLTPEKTASEQEAELRELIDNHLGRFAYANRYMKQKLNTDVCRHFGKPRAQMTIKELERCLKHVQVTYPLSFIRGTGRRVPTKAVPLNCEWR
jgi:superfamily II DNA or RNA helicase